MSAHAQGDATVAQAVLMVCLAAASCVSYANSVI